MLKSSTVLILLVLANALAYASENSSSNNQHNSTSAKNITIASSEWNSIEADTKSIVSDAKKDEAKVRTDVDSYGQKERQKLDHLSAEALTDLGARAHYDLAVISRFPSASQCADCHPREYKEWSASPHSYAQISPMFNAMQATFLKRSKGTNGDFCIRCHTEVGMTLKEPLFTANANRSAVSRQGITCVVCHRLEKPSDILIQTKLI